MAVDFRYILDVYPDDRSFTCAGTTKRGERCGQSCFKRVCLSEANDILDDLPQSQQYELLPKLSRLAYLTLCPRWHQSKLHQVESLAAKWLARIQNLAVRRPERLLLTPPPTPPRHTTAIYQQISNHSNPPPFQIVPRSFVYQPPYSPPPTPPTGLRVSGVPGADRYPSAPDDERNTFYQPAFGPPQTVAAPAANMTPHYNQQNLQRQQPNIQQRRGHARQTERNVNINFNINVDSNQVLQDHGRGTQVQDVVADDPSESGSTSSSSNGSRRARRSRSTSSASTSSTSTSSSSSSHNELRAEIIALGAENQALRTHPSSLQASRTSSRPTNPGSPVPSIARALTPSPRPSRRTSNASRSDLELANHHDFDEPPSARSSDSNSNPRPSRSRTRINTPSSSRDSSLVIISPPRSLSPAPIPRSAAPSPSSDSRSAVSVSVNRRPINDDTICYTCLDPIGSEADAAWCRAACGQNICLGCFLRWVGEQRADERRVVCGFCRSPWRF